MKNRKNQQPQSCFSVVKINFEFIFVLACIAIVVVSLCTKKPDESVEKTFDEVGAEVKAKA